MLKREGSRTEVFGTPINKLIKSMKELLILVLCFLSVRQPCITFRAS